MNLSLIFTLAVVLYAAVLAVIALLSARKRSWIMAIVRIGVTVVSAAVAIPLTKLVANASADLVYEQLMPLFGEELRGFLTEVPVGAEGMRVVAALVAAPAVYLLVFLVLRGLLSVAAWIVERVVPVLRERTLRAVSLPFGALNGVLIAVVTLIPLCGFLTLGAHMLNTFVDSDMGETALVRENVLDRFDLTEEELAETAEGLENHPVVIVIHRSVGKPVYDALTTAELDMSETHGTAVEMKLETELCGLLRTAGYAMEVMDSLEKEDYTAADKEYLFATADAFFASDWMKLLATDTLVAMSESWLQGEEFAGMARPAADAAVNPTLNCILEVLASETEETLEEDIHTIMDVVGDFLINDLLTDEADYAVMVQKMGESGLLTDMLAKLETNERMHTLAAELKALSIRLVTNMLGTDLVRNGEYAELMGSVAGTLNGVLDMSAEERADIVTASIKSSFDEHGFAVPDEVAVEMANQLIDDLGTDGEITADELTDYMVGRAEEGFDVVTDALPDGEAA